MIGFILLNIVFAMLTTLLVGGVTKWVSHWFTSHTRVAAMASACGYAVAKYSFVRPLGADITAPALAVLGAVLGIAVLWFMLFRMNRENAVS